VILRPAWSTERVPGQPGLHRETLSPPKKTQKIKLERRKEERKKGRKKRKERNLFQRHIFMNSPNTWWLLPHTDLLSLVVLLKKIFISISIYFSLLLRLISLWINILISFLYLII
jgi:hypothetical protein